MAHYSTTEFANESLLEPEVLALAARLRDIDQIQAPPTVLGIPSLLSELAAAARSAQAGRHMESQDDRRSLRQDLGQGIDILGPNFRRAAKGALAQLHEELPQLPDLLGSAGAAQRLEGVVESVREQCESSLAIEAAWADVAEAFLDDATADTCELRVLLLAELVDRRGGDWTSLRRTLSDILLNRPSAISVPVNPEPTGSDEDSELAGLTVDERIQLCGDVLRCQPERGDLTVWMAFENALLYQNYLAVGPVEFFAGQAWPEAIKQGWPHGDDEIKDEFKVESLGLFFGDPPSHPFVLVRVKLGEDYIGHGVEKATRLARDVIRAARLGSEWKAMRGAVAFVRGRGWWGSPLQKETPPHPHRFSPEFEPTADGLAEIDPNLPGRLQEGDPRLHSAIADIDWAERVTDLEDVTQRMALGVRLLERLLPGVPGEHWVAAAKRYLADVWCQMEIGTFVSEVAHNAVAVVEFDTEVVGWKQPWRERLLPSRGRKYRIEHAETIRALPELRELAPPFKLASRTVHELASRMESSDTVLAWKGELARQFDYLIERAARQRNEILHGSDTAQSVIESVDPFVGWLQRQLAYDALAAAEENKPLAFYLEHRRRNVRERWQAIAEGQDPVEVLFPGAK